MIRHLIRTATALACGLILATVPTVAHPAGDRPIFSADADITGGRIAYATTN